MKPAPRIPAALLLLATLASWGCAPDRPGAEEPAVVVVTTTLIETAARDLLGADAPVRRLMPPGACPGHFDIGPAQARGVATAALFIRHDFQAGLDAGLLKAGLAADRIVGLRSAPALTIPTNYVALCADLAGRLGRTWPELTARLQANLTLIARRAETEQQALQPRLAGWRGRKALCAVFQRDFCAWLGFAPVAVFHAGEDDSAWLLARAVDRARLAGAVAVIGNRQWGPRHLRALTEATGLPGIMLSNFPADGAPGAYWRLLAANVAALEQGLPP